MRLQNRKTTPKVKGGKVQRKNCWTLTAESQSAGQTMPIVDRRRPGQGYKHLLTPRHLMTFIDLLPDWDELAIGLNAVVLAPGDDGTDGWHTPGSIAICAWERELWRPATPEYFMEHADLFDRLGVASEAIKGGSLLQWTEDQAMAYQLLHIFLHELGHHHDRMTTRSRRAASRGESYAEQYAFAYADTIWDRYFDTFGLQI